jgi:hypothetical protein
MVASRGGAEPADDHDEYSNIDPTAPDIPHRSNRPAPVPLRLVTMSREKDFIRLHPTKRIRPALPVLFF